MSAELRRLSLAELIAALLILAAAALMLTAYLLDALGLPIDPLAVALLLAAELAGLLLAARAVGLRRPRLDGPGLAGFLVASLGLGGFALGLAWPSLLPRTHSLDTINHLALINFIQLHRGLPHDARLWDYLTDMMAYPPGSHLLAALVASWLGTSGVRVLHGVLAFFVALQAGFVYLIVLRLAPRSPAGPAFGLVGTALLPMAFEHVLGPLLRWGFYSQVVAETFALAMLWALVRYDQARTVGALLFFALCGLALLLTWPGVLPIPLLALGGLLLARRELPLRAKARDLAIGAGPIVLLTLVEAANRKQSAGILTAEGSVLTPTPEAYGWPLLGLGALGVALSLRSRRAWPALIFLGALLLQAGGLGVLQLRAQMTTFYLTFKTLYLLVYPLAIFGALALARLWGLLPSRLPGAGPRTAWAALAFALPLVVVGLDVARKPKIDWPSAINEPTYEAGLWARDNIPNGCLDFVLSKWPASWVTIEWLQSDVFGNPLESRATRRQVKKFQEHPNTRDRWDEPEPLPYALVSDWQALPREVRNSAPVVFRSSDGQVLILQRPDVAATSCRDDTPPLSQLALAPRRGVLAGILRVLSN